MTLFPTFISYADSAIHVQIWLWKTTVNRCKMIVGLWGINFCAFLQDNRDQISVSTINITTE